MQRFSHMQSVEEVYEICLTKHLTPTPGYEIISVLVERTKLGTHFTPETSGSGITR